MESELGWAVESHRCMVPQWRVHTVGRTPRDASERLSLDARCGQPSLPSEGASLGLKDVDAQLRCIVVDSIEYST